MRPAGPAPLRGICWRVTLAHALAAGAAAAVFAAARALWPGGAALPGALAAAVFAAGLALNHLLLRRRLLPPLERLGERLRAAGAGEPDPPADPPADSAPREARDELELLHRRFEAMLAGVRAAHAREVEAERRLAATQRDERFRAEFARVDVELTTRIAELDRANEQINALALELEERNASLVKAVKNISALNRVGVALSSELDLDRLVQLLIAISVKGLRVEAGAIFLFDERREQLALRAWSGFPEGFDATQRLWPGESVAGAVAASGQPLLIGLVDGTQGVRPRSRYGFSRRSVLCVPVKIKERVLGAIELANRRGEESFGLEDLEMLQSIANQAAVAIENANLYRELQRNYLETIRALVQAVEEKDRYTRGHSERVTFFAVKIARAMRIPERQVELLQYAGVLHDVGKIGIDRPIIHKTGRLTEDEFAEIRNHPLIGERILRPIGFLAGALPAVAQHHERFDGTGYPLGLSGERTVLEARILAVADAFDAMMTERPYRRPLTREDAVAELQRCAGSQFDPAVVEHFVEILDNDPDVQRVAAEKTAVGT